jgi:hypothetical protein
VIPVGRALLFAKPIYLQAERSPMPQLRLVILALQDALGYGPTFEAAMSSLFGEEAGRAAPASAGAGQLGTAAVPTSPGQTVPQAGAVAAGAVTLTPAVQALIDQAARDLADYQRLTAEGKLGEAGLKLESLKKTIERLKKER